MDAKDWKILNILRENSREFTKNLARKLNMPHSTVHERIKRLKNEGIIKKFTILPDYKKLGLDICAYVLISFEPNSSRTQRAVAEDIAKLPEVYNIDIITGRWDIIVKIRTSDINSLEEVILEKIRNIEGVERTETLVVLQTIKEIC